MTKKHKESCVELREVVNYSSPIYESILTTQNDNAPVPPSNSDVYVRGVRQHQSAAMNRRRSTSSGGWQRVRLQNTRLKSICECHDHDYPPWTGEIHGMSQALLSKSLPLRVFWWVVLFLCTSCGTATTILVIIEYLNGPTATSTTIRLVSSLELPAITVCPKVPDAFNFDSMFEDMRALLPRIDREIARDLVRFWLGGSGLENMDDLVEFNHSYIDHMAGLYAKWANGYDPKTFFNVMQKKYGYTCNDLFHYCELGGRQRDCCKMLFVKRSVMRRGICYQTRRGVQQTEADDIGRLVLSIKAPNSITSPIYNYNQPQIIIYINDNFDDILDFPRYYLYPHEWNRMHFSARLVELLEQHPDDCTSELVGKDAKCFVRNWLNANVINRFNCSLPYLMVDEGSSLPTCQPHVIAHDYESSIQLVHSGSMKAKTCIPGCKRWEYSVSLQQSPSLSPFVGHVFNLEASFYDLQYEHVKEVYTISMPGFMSQIGGQFGFFLGLSIITMIQIAIYTIRALAKIAFRFGQRTLSRIWALFAFVTLLCVRLLRLQREEPPDDFNQREDIQRTRNAGNENVAFAPTPPCSTPSNGAGGFVTPGSMTDSASVYLHLDGFASKSAMGHTSASSSATIEVGSRISTAGAAAAAAYRKRAALFVTSSAVSARSSPAQSPAGRTTLAAWPAFDFPPKQAVSSQLSSDHLSAARHAQLERYLSSPPIKPMSH